MIHAPVWPTDGQAIAYSVLSRSKKFVTFQVIFNDYTCMCSIIQKFGAILGTRDHY